MRATHKTLGRLRLSFVQVVHSHLSFVHWKSYVKSFALWYWNTFFTGTLYACCSPSPSSAHRATLHSHTLRDCERRWHRLRASSVFVHNEIICWNCYSNEYWDGNDARERTFFYDNWISFFFCPTPRMWMWHSYKMKKNDAFVCTTFRSAIRGLDAIALHKKKKTKVETMSSRCRCCFCLMDSDRECETERASYGQKHLWFMWTRIFSLSTRIRRIQSSQFI